MPLVADVPLDEVVYMDFITSTPSTSAAVDADSTPTFEVFEEATDTDIGVGGNATKRTSKTGNYRVTFTASAANGFELGKWYSVVASATVGAVVGKGVIGTFRVMAAENTAGYPVATIKDGTGTGEIDTTSGGVLVAALANNAITAASIADGAIDAATFAAGAIDAAAIAANAIGASELAADAATEIATAVWAAATRTLSALGFTLAASDLAADTLTAAKIAADVTTELQAGLATSASIAALNNLSQADVRTATGLASANLDTQLDALPTNAELATALGTADDAVLAAIAALNNLSIANIRTAVGLTSANLDTQLDALPTNAELATALGTADDAVLAALAALNNLSAAQVKTQVTDALAVDTYAEPAQGAPAATTTLAAKINYLYKGWRNKKTQSATEYDLYDDAGTTVDQKAALSDSGTVFTSGEVSSGP